ncbi:hypothetical protein Bca52824_034746 [Brassica carinata]|uniref:Uncharacterized protein n=1 Tax=Brassica carinata TaxID=52824 RepID=A0A8X7V140_BRACI|nr:hypothetical protein Bca52824_034746 [Brassica carinata]
MRSGYILAILFAMVVAATGNRLYPKPQLNGEQVDHSVLQSALSLKGAIATKSANKLTPTGGESAVRGRSLQRKDFNEPFEGDTERVKHNDIPVRQIEDAKLGFVSDKSMTDLLKFLVKPSQQASRKEEGNSLPSSEKTKTKKTLKSLQIGIRAGL